MLFPDRVITFNHRGGIISIKTEDKGNTNPVISHDAIYKSIKSSILAYTFFVKDSLPSQESTTNSSSTFEVNDMSLIKQYVDCFSNSILGALPPSRVETMTI